MNMNTAIQKVQSIDWKKHEVRIKDLIQKKPLYVALSVLVILFAINLLGVGSHHESRIMEHPKEVSFQNGRILNDRESTFYYGKEKLLSQKAQTLIDSQSKLETRLAELEKKLQEKQSSQNLNLNQPTTMEVGALKPNDQLQPTDSALQLYPNTADLSGGAVTTANNAAQTMRKLAVVSPKGPDLIAFPVKTDLKTEGVMLPAGSYVKAKVLTGVDVPEGKTYPVLMVLDFSYIAPNDHKVDLTGCFMIAKAEGDLSTERVQMQATKMSCVSKKGKMFEREVNGFVADDKDGSFAMQGKVNSKQGRVATMAFLASVVDGVGKAVQAAQTSQSTNGFGGSSSILTGDAGKYAVAGGASNAAGMVAQWYLQQAQNLAPTVAIGSGRDVWIVMKDKVNLPEEFFKKERKANDEGIYSYFTRILD